MLVQIYGQFGSNNSNAVVSRGIACSLVKAGLDVQAYDPFGVYSGFWTDMSTGHSPSAEVGIYVGYPPGAIPYLSSHEIKVGCFIAESGILPADWIAIASACDLVCVPSRWNAVSFVQGGVSPKKVLVMPHGLHPAFARKKQLEPPAGPVSFLHIAGAAGFRERKGTTKLISAFGKIARDHDHAQLTLRCGQADPEILSAIRRAEADDRVRLCEDDSLEPKRMRDFLCGAWDAIVLPSRAEAFGLLAIEARAVGLPVILTCCSGHKQHVESWDTIIESGPEAPIQVNGIPEGVAPIVEMSAILDAMSDFVAHRKSRWDWAQRGAFNYFDKNSWGKATGHLVRWLKSHRKNISRPGLHI